ncbi:hypothetical protein XM47_16310 [Catenovulum maritimum]|uniref:CAAX prenyl protease 2/Lysostaphin resistance protein A-like domain-containing protein n=1 Tax=Catenovulum maritimum TaxID=1513271 RepID=A0A0J8GTQ7_9ALTE|nr:hypothetical protein XM47_16310 [Catenovulum maritimum]
MFTPFSNLELLISLPQFLTLLPLALILLLDTRILVKLRLGLMGLSFVFGLVFSCFSLSAGIGIILAYFVIDYFNRAEQASIKSGLGCLLVVICTAFMLHLVPGFNNPLLLEATNLGSSSTPYQLYLNYDKLWIAVLLLALVPMSNALNSAYVPKLLLGFSFTCILGFSIAWVFELVQLDLKLPSILIPWIICNLLITCVAEEVFFRGFIQTQISNILGRYQYQYASIYSIIATALIFGLVHYPAGWLYVGIASLLGGSYGYYYLGTNNIKVPILMHFGFNLIHFLCFTYPY